MGYNSEINFSEFNVANIVKGLREGDYFVDRDFQRRLVWTDKQKVRLLETVLMEFPMPEVYVWQQIPDPETLAQSYSIVDGQQRMSSLRQFINNEWPLKKSYLDPERQGAAYADAFWKDLNQTDKTKILEYRINSRIIPSGVSKDDIRVIFARLNETDRSLNPQELRNATYNGEFLNASVALADSDEMKSLNIFSTNDVRRMLDVEFASQLLGYERSGITNESAASINDLYDKYGNEYPDKDKDIAKISKSLKLVIAIFSNTTVKGLFETQNNIYTLHSLFDVEPPRSADEWKVTLAKFATAYRSGSTEENIQEFRLGATSRTRSKVSRTQRLFGLRKWIRANSADASPR
jgi:uncharacterized protein with ParB-like and HNH nuclease domain